MSRHARRTTVGLLYSWSVYKGSRPSSYPLSLIEGAHAAAYNLGCNLLLSCGVRQSAWPESGATSDYAPVGPWNTDGLLVIAPLDSPEKHAYLDQLHRSGFPIVFISRYDDSYPTVCTDSEAGVHKALEHLVCQHGHRQIAFIAGYDFDPGDSRIRLESYQRFMQESDLEVDPRLIAYGGHSEEGGYQAMQTVLRAGASFSAVMGSNDYSTIGAMQALREAGKRIPQDVAVIGFDNILASLAQVPALATVHYSIFDLGQQGLKLLVDIIHDREKSTDKKAGPSPAPPPAIKIPTSFVPRQSCGCLPKIYLKAPASQPDPSKDVEKARPDPSQREIPARARLRRIVNEMVDEIVQAAGNPGAYPFIHMFCARLVKIYHDCLTSGDVETYRSRLMDLTAQMDGLDENADHGQLAVSVLRNFKSEFPASDETKEDLLHLSRELFSQGINRRMVRNTLQWNDDLQKTGMMALQLLGARSQNESLQAFFRNMHAIGVLRGWVLLYEPSHEHPFQHAILWSHAGGTLKKLRIRTHDFPGPGVLTGNSSHTLAILPLLQHEDTVIGAVAVETENYRPLAMAIDELAAAIHSSRLHEEVVNLSLTDELTGVNNRRYFDIFAGKEVERCRRFDRTLALIMFDVDHMKDINDQHGHLSGDEVLRWVARQTLKSVRRGVDIVTRYGGDEFAILLPETDAKNALVIAERIRKALAERIVSKQSVTASIGIAVVSGKEADAESLVKWADVALYKAKERRDSICIFT